jgi:5-(carboxyamino)imidazole ribonucleotide synthase
MLALAGLPLGVRFRFLDPQSELPAGQLGERIDGEYTDPVALDRFAEGCDVVTYEFENVPVASARHLASCVPVHPAPEALEVSQDRLVEKQFLSSLGIPTPAFAEVDSLPALEGAVARVGLPAVLKTRRLGYDGKGQIVLRMPGDVAGAWEALEGSPAILEGFVPFDRELSVLAVRGRDRTTRFYPLVENEHRGGILRVSIAPAPGVTAELQRSAEGYAVRIMDALDYVGVLALELFQHDGRLVANEMAPRVHNSGHWTIEGAETSQFENHLRAVLGWPLGGASAVGYSGMVNLIGAVPETADVLAVPGAHLHLYGKAARPGRKVGHVTVWGVEPGVRDRGVGVLRALVG